ncbi:MAG: hypothetical protein ABSA76_07845 [Bacteroidales bacterium]
MHLIVAVVMARQKDNMTLYLKMEAGCLQRQSANSTGKDGWDYNPFCLHQVQ